MYFEETKEITIDDNTYKITDTNRFPVIETTNLQDIFHLQFIDDKFRNKRFDHYEYNGIQVPRVTKILDGISKIELSFWLGKVGNAESKRIQEESTFIGSHVHEMIDNFLLTGKDEDRSSIMSQNRWVQVLTAYNNFKNWIKYINNMGFFIEEIVGIEIPVVCHLYGGTIDAIVKINGRYYIIDFKTSKKISTNYLLQTSAYYWAVNNGFISDKYPCLSVNGVGIIRVDKIYKEFEDYFLNDFIPVQREILDNYITTWGNILAAYYTYENSKKMFMNYKKNYNLKGVLK